MVSIPQQIGNYKLERKLGRGATSEVWLAHHAYLEQRQVALKILLSQESETMQRFQREANLGSILHHPNIVQVFDHGTYPIQKSSGHLLYTVMEYVHGGSLQTLLERQGSLPFVEAFDIFKQIATALDYAHSLDIVHRDVAPGNVLIEQATGRVVLTDFGIARNLNQNITVDTAVMGTPGYWSPEHTLSATSVTPLSDIYGLGVILYVMLSGELPWDESAGLPYRPSGPPPPLKERGVSNLPPDVDRVLQALLAVDPTRRFPSGQAAVEQLERIIKRHHIPTQIALLAPPSEQGQQIGLGYQSSGMELDEVELALGANLQRVPLTRAYERAEHMRDPAVITALLDSWAIRGRFRRAMLGRLMRLHQVSSHNLYSYRLRVLYEHREQPQTSEEPDYDAKVFPLEPQLARWQVPLVPTQDFTADSDGQMVLPGSARVVRCPPCEGLGRIICPRCKGKQRIYEKRAAEPARGLAAGASASEMNAQAVLDQTVPGVKTDIVSPLPKPARFEQVLVPCPECAGTGGLHCDRCDGVGRLVQQSIFHWKRTTRRFVFQDNPPALDKKWFARSCVSHEIYSDRSEGNGQTNGVPFRAEWSQIPRLQELLEQAQAESNDDTRIVLSEVTISFIPMTEIVFDLSDDVRSEEHLYRLAIYGFENAIPADWRFLNWERIILLSLSVFLVILVLILGFFAFTG